MGTSCSLWASLQFATECKCGWLKCNGVCSRTGTPPVPLAWRCTAKNDSGAWIFIKTFKTKSLPDARREWEVTGRYLQPPHPNVTGMLQYEDRLAPEVSVPYLGHVCIHSPNPNVRNTEGSASVRSNTTLARTLPPPLHLCLSL